MFEAAAYLDAKVPSVHVVAEEQIARAAGGSAHLEKLHQVKELAVDVSAHWTQKHKKFYECVLFHFVLKKKKKDIYFIIMS